MDFLLALDPALPKRRAVESALRRGIAMGALPVESRLPSARDLAAEFGVARGTVTAAIDDLVADGVLVARERTGTFVARRSGSVSDAPPPPLSHGVPGDLRPGRPEVDSFPLARWAAALRRAAANTRPRGHADDDGRGALELRQELARYLSRSRGVESSPDSIVICAGYRSAMTLLATALKPMGVERAALEDPGLPEAEVAWRAAGIDVTSLHVDESGARIDHLDATSDVAIVTPAHQFPLGVVLGADRRRAAAAWADAHRGLIVEDDYDGEFRYDRRPIAALQRSAPERVVYVGSTSKTLDTTIRLGWMVLPSDLVRPVAAANLSLTGGAPLLDQLALAHLLREGEFERHVRRQRREYSRRRHHVDEVLARHGVTPGGVAAGLQLTVPLSRAVPADEWGTVRSARLTLHLLSRYTRQTDYPPAVVLGFATPPRTQFERAVDAFAEWLALGDEAITSRAPSPPEA
ncbi:PLP-dependent aminotransferase family protein [Microbacterium testaceum]|uniref:MocR-like pyridoxine biosynthesis transcription factor PdxR n=1 Tax=Microbacterium testaceum TaxID=2033 RepID=UPI003430E8E2